MDYPNYGKSLDLRLVLIIPYRRERIEVNCAMLVSLDKFEECEPYLFLDHLHGIILIDIIIIIFRESII